MDNVTQNLAQLKKQQQNLTYFLSKNVNELVGRLQLALCLSYMASLVSSCSERLRLNELRCHVHAAPWGPQTKTHVELQSPALAWICSRRRLVISVPELLTVMSRM